jgi:hypothetical protein
MSIEENFKDNRERRFLLVTSTNYVLQLRIYSPRQIILQKVHCDDFFLF